MTIWQSTLPYGAAHSAVWQTIRQRPVIQDQVGKRQLKAASELCRLAFGEDMPVLLCVFHIKRAWLNFLLQKVTSNGSFDISSPPRSHLTPVGKSRLIGVRMPFA
jgi:hypothetical protein